jgi:hypothetical protein
MLLQSIEKAKLRQTNLVLNLLITLIIFNGLCQFCLMPIVFMFHAFVSQFWNMHVATLDFSPQNPSKEPQNPPSKSPPQKPQMHPLQW